MMGEGLGMGLVLSSIPNKTTAPTRPAFPHQWWGQRVQAVSFAPTFDVSAQSQVEESLESL
ncbi:MAG: hypothetical protein RLZZ609_2662 [Cyanobacteriota bacterium]|jgi:hypothetical protein